MCDLSVLMHLSWPLRPGEADNKADKLVGPRYTKCRGFHHSLSVVSLMKCMSKAWRRRHNAEFYSIIRRDRRGAVMIVANKKCQLTSAFVMRILKATKVSKYSWKLYRKYVIKRSYIVRPASVANGFAWGCLCAKRNEESAKISECADGVQSSNNAQESSLRFD